MDKKSNRYKWDRTDKTYYFISLIFFIVSFVGAGYILVTVSFWLLVLFVGLYIMASVFQAGACVGCPYRGRFCPAIFGVYLANILLSRVYKNRSFSQKFFNINATLASIMAILTLLLPIYWLIINSWYYLVIYLTLVIVHLYLFYRCFCPKCSYNETCPGGRTVNKLMKREEYK